MMLLLTNVFLGKRTDTSWFVDKKDNGSRTMALSNSISPSEEGASVAEEKIQVRDLRSHRLTA